MLERDEWYLEVDPTPGAHSRQECLGRSTAALGSVQPGRGQVRRVGNIHAKNIVAL